jgi:hypothetical protein
MHKTDFIKLIGLESEDQEYLPVAFMLRSGYGCAGYYNAALNRDLVDTCVLLNSHLVEFRGESPSGQRATIHDFNEFLREIVSRIYREEDGIPSQAKDSDLYGQSIPLMAVDFAEIALLYPVAHITSLLRRAEDSLQSRVPTFLDIENKSVIVKLLRTKLW